MIALNIYGSVVVCGANLYGDLGLGFAALQPIPVMLPNFANVTDIGVGADFSILIDSGGYAYSTGSNTHGQLGLNDTRITFISRHTLIPNLFNLTKVFCGSHYAFVVNATGAVYAFGYNNVIKSKFTFRMGNLG
jgi:alpha-tubulin suppressor-like RCC1 family protein